MRFFLSSPFLIVNFRNSGINILVWNFVVSRVSLELWAITSCRYLEVIVLSLFVKTVFIRSCFTPL